MIQTVRIIFLYNYSHSSSTIDDDMVITETYEVSR